MLATVLWAGNFVLARGLRDDVPAIALTFWRWTIAAAILAPFAARGTWVVRHEIRRNMPHVAVTGLLGVTVYNTLVYQAGHSTHAVNLALIAVCSPIMIVLLSRVSTGELITATRAIGILAAAIGVVLLATGGSLQQLARLQFATGDLLMLVASAIFALYTLLVRHRPSAIGVTPFVFATFVIGDLLLLPVYLAQLVVSGPFSLDRGSVAALAYIGTGPSLIAFYAWNQAVTRIGASRPGVIYYLVPVFTGLAAWPLLGEQITVAEGAAMVLVLVGVALGTRTPSRASDLDEITSP